MGGQACVFYGAAQFSKDVDLALLATEEKMIDALVEGHYRALGGEPTAERVAFWLSESRTPERLMGLAQRFPNEARAQTSRRPLLRLAVSGESEALREALDAEARAEQAKDRAYWAPLKAEFEAFRRAER
jgi:hypothetical protein